MTQKVAEREEVFGRWYGRVTKGQIKASLTEMHVSQDVAMSLLYIRALRKEAISVLFLPVKAFLIDIKDKNYVLGYVKQETDGLYYIAAYQDVYPIDRTAEDNVVLTFISVAKHISTKQQYADSDDYTALSQHEKTPRVHSMPKCSTN